MSTIPSTTHEPTTVHPCMGGVQAKYKFPNGYGASVIRHEGSYGSASGLWELGVLGPNGHLTYDTPVTNDVLGYLTEADVQTHLDAIAELPAVTK